MTLPNYYKILKLDPSADPEQIWLSYHKLVFTNTRSDQAGNLNKLLELDEAYEVLSQPRKKIAYDKLYKNKNFLGLSLDLRRQLVIFLTGFFTGILTFFALRAHY